MSLTLHTSRKTEGRRMTSLREKYRPSPKAKARLLRSRPNLSQFKKHHLRAITLLSLEKL